MLYDPYQNSLLLIHNRGAARLSMVADILVQYKVPASSPASSAVAVDGSGNVLVVVSAVSGNSFPPSGPPSFPFPGINLPFDFYLFAPDASLLARLVNASTSSCVVLDGASSVIWTANSTSAVLLANSSFRLFSVSYVTGLPTALLPAITGSLQQMAAYDATRLAVLVNNWQDKVYNSSTWSPPPLASPPCWSRWTLAAHTSRRPPSALARTTPCSTSTAEPTTSAGTWATLCQ